MSGRMPRCKSNNTRQLGKGSQANKRQAWHEQPATRTQTPQRRRETTVAKTTTAA